MKKTKLLLILTGLLLFFNSRAQEIVTGLSENPVVREKAEKILKSGTARELQKIAPVKLPFFDDFREATVFPDTSLWLDNEAYINYDFGKFSANRGVATLDVIDAEGYVYDHASEFPFVADRLTSKPIRLDSIFEPVPAPIAPADSVYLSFYYQPQGRGDAPQPADSLILEFGTYGQDSLFTGIDSILIPASEYIGENDTIFPFDSINSPCNENWVFAVFDTIFYNDVISVPCDSIFEPVIDWTRVWSVPGMPLDTFLSRNGTWSKQVLIPITDSGKYFKKHFFFRFYNLATMASIPSWKSNCDQWNIDYVYLNIGRSANDVNYRDIGFVQRAPSLLKNYEMMPWEQYLQNPTNEIKTQFRLYITNLDNNTYSTIYSYRLTDQDGGLDKIYDGGLCNLQPTVDTNYQDCEDCAQHACPPWNFLFPLDFSKESAVFKIDHILLGDYTTADTISDTMTHYQRFYNFYAYDDGTAEAGYGVAKPGEKAALKFKLNRPDTLYGLQMFINRTQNNANDQYFTLAVWGDNNGVPGELLYTQAGVKPKFPTSLNQMQFYEFDEGVPVNNIFYVGWLQQSNYLLNVGYDRFNNARENSFFYSIDVGAWSMSINEGAMMIRPVMSDEFITSEDELIASRQEHPEFYPNPLNQDILRIKWADYNNSEKEFAIFNVYGQLVRSGLFTDRIGMNGIKNGMYVVRVFHPETGEIFSEKIILSR